MKRLFKGAMDTLVDNDQDSDNSCVLSNIYWKDEFSSNRSFEHEKNIQNIVYFFAKI